jgi:hypothetical protein
MDTYHVVLYIHLLFLFIGIGAAGALLTCLTQLRSAQTLETAAPWGMVAGKVEKFFPIAIVGLFATGAYLTSDVWSWSTGWIVVSICGLVVVALQGPLLGGRTAKKLEHALMENGPGQLSPATRRMARHPGLWVAELANIALVLGIVWNMTQKPGTGEAIATLVIAYIVGAALAWQMSKLPATEARPATEPTG